MSFTTYNVQRLTLNVEIVVGVVGCWLLVVGVVSVATYVSIRAPNVVSHRHAGTVVLAHVCYTMWQEPQLHILVLEAYILVCSVLFIGTTLSDDDLASNYALCVASCTSMLLALVFTIPTVKQTHMMHAYCLLYVQAVCVVVMLGCVFV